MKLWQAPASPYARKVRVVIIECGIEDKVEMIAQSPRDETGAFYAINPIRRIPALDIGDGTILFDSPVICEYLDATHQGGLLPQSGPERWDTLKRQAFGDGIMDAAVPVAQSKRPGEVDPGEAWYARMHGMILGPMDELDRLAAAGKLTQEPDLGTLAIACALGYVDFRHGHLNWRDGRDALAAWEAAVRERPSLKATVPTG